MTDLRMERGLVIVLPGIEGRSALNEAICHGLADGGVDWAIQLCDWTSILGPPYNLRAEIRNRQEAMKIAERITRYHWNYPGRPVVLVGQSGGSAIAAWVAEALPRGSQIDGIIMIAPALSPQYLLDWALENSRRGIINFYSPRDWFLLGVGTTVFGTMDGEHTSSAGRTGFETPPASDPKGPYRKLLQIRWNPDMAEAGYTGTHLTSGAARFVAAYIVPFVLTGRWDQDTVDQVLLGNGRRGDSPRPADVPAPTSRPAERKAPPVTTRPTVRDMKDGRPLPWDEFNRTP